MLTLQHHKSIFEIEEAHWDSLLTSDDYFHTHRFISVVEESKIENADFDYLLFYEGEQLVGTAVLSAFTISLDLFIAKNKLAETLKKAFPKMLEVKLLVCGLPASFGQLNLKLIDELYAVDVCAMLTAEMKKLAKTRGIHLLAVKEMNAANEQGFRAFGEKGFFKANSIPYMQLNLSWKSFADYLSSLRHPYRRKMVKSLRKMQQTEPLILDACSYDQSATKPAFVLTEPAKDFAQQFHNLYLCVMQRTATKLETLNLNFFNHFFQKEKGCKVLSIVVQGKIISSALLLFEGDTLLFLLVGREKEQDDYDSYFNLLYGIIQLGIKGGFKKIKMGQTAYWVKQQVGAKAEHETFYLLSRRPLLHWILRMFRSVIFPETKLQNVHVFRSIVSPQHSVVRMIGTNKMIKLP